MICNKSVFDRYSRHFVIGGLIATATGIAGYMFLPETQHILNLIAGFCFGLGATLMIRGLVAIASKRRGNAATEDKSHAM